MTKKPIQKITRELLANGTIQQMARDRDGANANIMSDDELIPSRRSLIPDNPDEDVWVFAYGSLIWNPALEIRESKLGRIYGYHRRFCLRTRIGRGTPEKPGLILGLDRGGCCPGQVLRIDRKDAMAELDLLWRREMLNKSYVPKLLKVRCDDGSRVTAVSFVINRKSESYVAELPIEQKAEIIATAHGFIGPCLEYLERTHESLAALSIHDRYLDRILKMISKNAGKPLQ